MKNKFILAVTIALVLMAFGPPNRNLFKDDPACYEACIEAETAITYPQGARTSQMHFDKSIALCPSFAYSHYEKAVPYAKRGDIGAWKKMIDEAVKHEPKDYLQHRAWYHWFFMHNFQKAIDDIDLLESMIDYDLGPCGDGEYHLEMVRALSYKGLGESEKAIHLMEDLLDKEDADPFNYDLFHLGVLYLEAGEVDKAISTFERQTEIYEWASNQYFMGLAYKQKGELDQATEHLEQAEDLYARGITMDNSYRHRMDRIYRVDIERELATLTSGL